MPKEKELPDKWRKNLYTNTGYSDSYTDVSFLASLKTNVNQSRVTYYEAFLGAGLVTEQICMVFVFYIMYGVIQNEDFSAESVMLLSSVISGFCYLYFLSNSDQTQTLGAHSKIVFLFIILGYLLSPVLKTLTETISSDTIDAASITMMLIHLIFFDYQVTSALSSRALSLNAAIFASLCLASRVATSFQAFVLLTVSAECFVLYPTFAYSVRQKLTMSYLSGLIALTLFVMCSLAVLKMGVLFVIIVFFLNIVFPALFIHWQKYKMNIYGPWDEAIIETKTDSI